MNNACCAKQAYSFVTVSLAHELISSLSLAGVCFAKGFMLIPGSISLAQGMEMESASWVLSFPPFTYILHQAHLRDMTSQVTF